MPLYWITGSYVLAAVATTWAPESVRPTLWILLGVTYILLCIRGATSLSSSILGPCINRGDVPGKIALTYDDGPAVRGTPELLDLLGSRDVKASFFCVGRQVDANPELVRRIHEEGHLLGNHSYSHRPWITFARTRTLSEDLLRCQRSIESITGERPRLYRPPYGLRSHATLPAAQRANLRVIGWSAGGGDTKGRPVESIVARITQELESGSIILLHDLVPDPSTVVEVTRQVLDAAKQRGLQPVRLDELLQTV